MIDNKSKYITPSTIALELLRLLDRADSIKNPSVLVHYERKEITQSVNRISKFIKYLYRYNTFVDSATQWSAVEMDKAADNFLSLASWIYFPQSTTIECFKEKICIYLNIVLTGNYHELPREPIERLSGLTSFQEKVKGFRKFLMFLYLGGYMALPVIILIVFIVLTRIEVPALAQSALGIIYVVWIILGLFTFSDRLNPDFKEYLKDILKGWISKKS